MKLAIFDFDGTLFPKDTLPFLFSQWKVQKNSKLKYYKTYVPLIGLYLKYKTGITSKYSREQMKLMAMTKFNCIFKGMTEDEVKNYFVNCSNALKGLLNERIVSEIDKASAKGYHTVLLSGSYDCFLNLIAKEIGFDTVIATKMPFNKGLFDEKQALKIISGVLKLQKIKEVFCEQSIDWEGSLAYADSYSDLHILEAVGQPIVVNPDEGLKSIAMNKNWRVIV